MKALANTGFCKKKLDTRFDTHCIKVSKLVSSYGGPEGIRTLDLSDANRTLSQLSYGPI